MSMDTVHLLVGIEDLAKAWVSILSKGTIRWLFNQERSMTGILLPVFFNTKDKWLKNPDMLGLKTGLIAPLYKTQTQTGVYST